MKENLRNLDFGEYMKKEKERFKRIIALINEIKKKNPKETTISKVEGIMDIVYEREKPYYKLLVSLTEEGDLIDGFLEYERKKGIIELRTIPSLKDLERELKGILKSLEI